MAFHNRYRGVKSWWWYTPRHRWLEYSPHGTSTMPAVPACYVLSLDGVVVYVGQTLNLKTRFYRHNIKCVAESQWITRWGQLDGDLRLRAKFGQKYGDWAMREARLIARLAPRFNVQGV